MMRKTSLTDPASSHFITADLIHTFITEDLVSQIGLHWVMSMTMMGKREMVSRTM